MGEERRLQAGRVALVTGAAQGIGRAVARRLSAEGATVAVNDLPDARLAALAHELGGFAAPADVSDHGQILSMAREIESALGAIDILVCNAAYMSMAPLLEHSPADWWRVIDTNLTGSFYLIQAVLPGMRRQGAGRIVIISSYWGVIGWPEATAYAASKAGLIALTKTLGRELAPSGIVVNAVAPGVISTPQLEVDAAAAGVDVEEMRRRYAAQVPLGRIGHPEEVASAVALLADFELGAMVGQVLQVNGGEIRTRA
jgi:NAD(P)-dependent dehydrogenase (short-subunit alcohol dehydrogenase family)